MGKIVSNFFISLDGVVESPDQWHFPYFNDEMGVAIEKGSQASTASDPPPTPRRSRDLHDRRPQPDLRSGRRLTPPRKCVTFVDRSAFTSRTGEVQDH